MVSPSMEQRCRGVVRPSRIRCSGPTGGLHRSRTPSRGPLGSVPPSDGGAEGQGPRRRPAGALRRRRDTSLRWKVARAQRWARSGARSARNLRTRRLDPNAPIRLKTCDRLDRPRAGPPRSGIPLRPVEWVAAAARFGSGRRTQDDRRGSCAPWRHAGSDDRVFAVGGRLLCLAFPVGGDLGAG